MPNCPKCSAAYDANQKNCPGCGFEFRPQPAEKEFPLIFYPIVILFLIYLFWELGEKLLSAP